MERDELPPFVTLVKNVFQQRRKTIQNTLKSFYSLSQSELDRIETEAGINLGSRPEELGKEEFLKLLRILAGTAGGRTVPR